MIALVVFLVVLVLAHELLRAVEKRETPLFDRLPCPHCGAGGQKPGTGCLDCGTWVGR